MRLKATTVVEEFMVCGNWFQRVVSNTPNDPSPIRLLLFGMARRVTSWFGGRPSLDGIVVAMQPVR